MRCRTASTALIAARDGELGAHRRRALDRHLARCGGCRAEQVAIDGVLAVLDRLPTDAEVPARLEQNVMRRVRALADESETRRATVSRWLRVLAPPLAAGVVAAATMLTFRGAIEPTSSAPPSAVARAPRREPAVVARRPKTAVPDVPPAELASRPDLFVDMPILRDMDKLQHFDSIAAMDDDPTDAVTPP